MATFAKILNGKYMACTMEFIDFVCQKIENVGVIRSRKMFGDWLIYVNEKPLLLCCDNQVYIKKHPAIEHLMRDAECAVPYDGAKEHYILDVGHSTEACKVIRTLEEATPLPKSKKK